MKKIKVMRGHPVYVYKGTNYIDKPDKVVISKMLFDEENNITYVYCSKPRKLVEIACSIIMILCVCLNVFGIHRSEVIVRYNSVSTYYNDLLYLNLVNDESSVVPIRYDLLDGEVVVCSGVIKPGDIVISTPVGNIKDTYTLRISYTMFITEHVEDVRISVVDRSIR